MSKKWEAVHSIATRPGLCMRVTNEIRGFILLSWLFGRCKLMHILLLITSNWE